MAAVAAVVLSTKKHALDDNQPHLSNKRLKCSSDEKEDKSKKEPVYKEPSVAMMVASRIFMDVQLLECQKRLAEAEKQLADFKDKLIEPKLNESEMYWTTTPSLPNEHVLTSEDGSCVVTGILSHSIIGTDGEATQTDWLEGIISEAAGVNMILASLHYARFKKSIVITRATTGVVGISCIRISCEDPKGKIHIQQSHIDLIRSALVGTHSLYEHRATNHTGRFYTKVVCLDQRDDIVKTVPDHSIILPDDPFEGIIRGDFILDLRRCVIVPDK